MTKNNLNKFRTSKHQIATLVLAIACFLLLESCGGRGGSAAPGSTANTNSTSPTAAQSEALRISQDYSPSGSVPSPDTDTLPLPAKSTLPDNRGVQDGRIEIYAKDDVTFDSMKKFIEGKGWKLVGYVRNGNGYTVDLQGSSTIEDAIEAAELSPLVDWAEALSLMKTFNAISNDSHYADNSENSQKKSDRNLKAIRAPEAWRLLEEKNELIRIGVLDGGFRYSHEDLEIRSISARIGTIEESQIMPCSTDNSVAYCNSSEHGMTVAGIIGARRNNFLGIAGSGSNAVYMHAHRTILDNDSIKIGFATLASKNVRAINFSIAESFCPTDSTGNRMCVSKSSALDSLKIKRSSLQEGIDKFLQHERRRVISVARSSPDTLFVQASGNNGDLSWSGTTERVSADYSGWFASAVSKSGSIDSNLEKTIDGIRKQVLVVGAYSVDKNTGAKSIWPRTQLPLDANDKDFPFILAPGVDVESTGFKGTNQYITDSGTSLAAPHVTGVVALVLQANSSLKASEVQNIILSSADGADGQPYKSGYRYLNAERAVMMAIDSLNKCGTITAPVPAGQQGPAYFVNEGDNVSLTSIATPKSSFPFTRFSWSFSDGSASIDTTQPQASHKFSQPGTTSVSVTPFVGTVACKSESISVTVRKAEITTSRPMGIVGGEYYAARLEKGVPFTVTPNNFFTPNIYDGWTVFINLPEISVDGLTVEFDAPYKCESIMISLRTDESEKHPRTANEWAGVFFDGEKILAFDAVTWPQFGLYAPFIGHYSIQFSQKDTDHVEWKILYPQLSSIKARGGIVESSGKIKGMMVPFRDSAFKDKVYANMHVTADRDCSVQNFRVSNAQGNLL